jgi:hypothetical protein
VRHRLDISEQEPQLRSTYLEDVRRSDQWSVCDASWG